MVASLAGLSLTATAPPVGAAVTIGQLGPDGSPPPTCTTTAVDQAQQSVTSGNSYVVPGTGTITSWSHNATGGPDQTLTMKIFRKVAEPARYMVVSHDGPRPLTESTVNTFATSIPVDPGDVLGLNQASGGGGTQCRFPAPGELAHPLRFGNLGDGEPEDFMFGTPDTRMNITAVFVPTNTFRLGKVKLNKKKGTATLTVENIPNAGEIVASGKGVKMAGAAGAVVAKTVTAPGEVKLKIRAKGKKKQQLDETGQVKVKVKVTYTPTGGDPSAASRQLRLKRR